MAVVALDGVAIDDADVVVLDGVAVDVTSRAQQRTFPPFGPTTSGTTMGTDEEAGLAPLPRGRGLRHNLQRWLATRSLESGILSASHNLGMCQRCRGVVYSPQNACLRAYSDDPRLRVCHACARVAADLHDNQNFTTRCPGCGLEVDTDVVWD